MYNHYSKGEIIFFFLIMEEKFAFKVFSFINYNLVVHIFSNMYVFIKRRACSVPETRVNLE